MRFVLALVTLLFATPTLAQNYAAAPQVNGRRLAEGGEAHAVMDVEAPPAAVWAVLSDCPNATRFMRQLLSCRVLERGEGWEVLEHRVSGGPFRGVLRNVSRVTLEPYRRMSFHRIDGDWTRSEGEWRLIPIDGGRGTRVEYEVAAALEGGLPAGITQSYLVYSVRRTLTALRREAERAS